MVHAVAPLLNYYYRNSISVTNSEQYNGRALWFTVMEAAVVKVRDGHGRQMLSEGK